VTCTAWSAVGPSDHAGRYARPVSYVDSEILEQRLWLTWPSTMPLLKQPAVTRETEWAWLWDHVIPKDDIVLDKASVRPHIDAAITGAPGIGKSTLVQMFGVSQTVAAHFPDGILYANQQTADVRVWLSRWAEQYGLDLPKAAKPYCGAMRCESSSCGWQCL